MKYTNTGTHDLSFVSNGAHYSCRVGETIEINDPRVEFDVKYHKWKLTPTPPKAEKTVDLPPKTFTLPTPVKSK